MSDKYFVDTNILMYAHDTAEALEIEVRYHVSFWDALVIQAAQVAGAAILYSEDLSDGQEYGGVRVKNPMISRAMDG